MDDEKRATLKLKKAINSNYILEHITNEGKVETTKYYSSRNGKIRNKTKQRKDSLNEHTRDFNKPN